MTKHIQTFTVAMCYLKEFVEAYRRFVFGSQGDVLAQQALQPLDKVFHTVEQFIREGEPDTGGKDEPEIYEITEYDNVEEARLAMNSLENLHFPYKFEKYCEDEKRASLVGVGRWRIAIYAPDSRQVRRFD